MYLYVCMWTQMSNLRKDWGNTSRIANNQGTARCFRCKSHCAWYTGCHSAKTNRCKVHQRQFLKCTKSHLIRAKEFFQQFEPKFQCFSAGRTGNQPSFQDICFQIISLTSSWCEELCPIICHKHISEYSPEDMPEDTRTTVRMFVRKTHLHASMFAGIMWNIELFSKDLNQTTQLVAEKLFRMRPSCIVVLSHEIGWHVCQIDARAANRHISGKENYMHMLYKYMFVVLLTKTVYYGWFRYLKTKLQAFSLKPPVHGSVEHPSLLERNCS